MIEEVKKHERLIHQDKTEAIIGAFYAVYNTLGHGFLEKVYENALAYELRKRGFHVEQQLPIKVYYDGLVVGEYFADIAVDDAVIIELKAAEQISDRYIIQLLNYLRATKFEVGLVLNFGPEARFRRKAYANSRKKNIDQQG